MKIDLKYYINLTVAIAAIAIPSYISWNSTRPSETERPSLTVSEKSRFQLENQKNYAGSQLDYYLNNQKIERFTTSIYSIVNTGKPSIESKDFISPLTITPTSEALIVSASILNSDPPTLKPSFSWTKGGALTIDPKLLNSGDEITVAIVSRPAESKKSTPVSGEITQDTSSHLQWSARVKNMKDLNVISFEEISKKQRVILLTEPASTIEQLSNGWEIILSTKSILPFIFATLLLFFFVSQFLSPPFFSSTITAKDKITLFILFFTSISAGEVVIFYVFHRSEIFVGLHYLNVGILAIYVFLCTTLFLLKRSKSGSTNK